jgi:hypothetical protein
MYAALCRTISSEETMGLLDAFLNPNQEQSQGLLAMASQLLQAGGPSNRPVGFGQALGGGLQAYQGAMEQARHRKMQEEQFRMEQEQARQMAAMRGLQMQGLRDDLAIKGEQRKRMERIRTRLTDPAAASTVTPDAQQQAPQDYANVPNAPEWYTAFRAQQPGKVPSLPG